MYLPIQFKNIKFDKLIKSGSPYKVSNTNELYKAALATKEALKVDPYFYFSSSGLSTAQRYQLVNYTEAWSLINVGSFDRAEEHQYLQ